MEQDQNASLFGLTVDTPSRPFLSETPKSGKFLPIMGFISCGIVVIIGIFMAVYTSDVERVYGQYGRDTTRGLGVVQAVTFIILALIYFFPCLYLLRFSNHMRAALAAEDQGHLL